MSYIVRPPEGENPLARFAAHAADPEAAAAIAAARVLAVEVLPARRAWHMRVWFPRAIAPAALEALERSVEASAPGLAFVRIEAVYPADGDAAAALLRDRWRDVVAKVGAAAPTARGWLRLSRAAVEGGRIRVEVLGEAAAEALRRARGDSAIAEAVFEETHERLEVEFVPGAFRAEASAVLTAAAATARREARQAAGPREAAPGQAILGRPIPHGQAVAPIRDLAGERRGVVVEGEVFDVLPPDPEAGPPGGRGRPLAFSITDYGDSIRVKVYDSPAAFLPRDGERYRIRGDVVRDKFDQDLVLRGKDVAKAAALRAEDPAPEKRLELHAHTTFSRMDSTADAERLVERAADWGHAAIAVTDHGVVHGLAAAHAAARRRKIRLLLGCEAYCVDDVSPIARRAAGRAVDADAVVLDLETTGLSPRTAAIIEVGAFRVRGTKVVDEFHALVDPGRGLPPAVTRLTGIGDDDVRGKPPIEEVAGALRAFLGDSPVVAHNAEFDAGFLRRTLPGFDSPVVDTLRLAHALRPDLTDFRLGSLARSYGVPLAGGHRAADDARALSRIWIEMSRALRRRGVEELEGMNRLVAEIPTSLLRAFRATLLVRSEAGRTNLYRLVSASHIEHFHRRPRVPWSLLEARREGLLVGTGPAGRPFAAFLSGADPADLDASLRAYDYVEIVPPEAHGAHLADGVFPGEEDLRAALTEWVARADRLGLPVAAVSDAHGIDPHEVRYRRILKAGLERPYADVVPPSYLRTTPEMLEAFSFLGPERARRAVIETPREIAARCDDVAPIPKGFHPPTVEGAAEDVSERARRRARALYGDDPPVLVQERVQRELAAIVGNGYAALYAIAARLVERSVADGFPVGSRGSVGSSLVAFLCGITEVNPLPPHVRCPRCRTIEFRDEAAAGPDLPPAACPDCGGPLERDGWDIPFEAFMGLAGEKVPDIDLNFSGEYQARAMRQLEETFGRERVFRAGTILSIQEKNAHGYVKKYVESRALTPRFAEIRRLSRGVTGVARTTGQHPGGVVLVPADRDVNEFTPIQYPADARVRESRTTHFDYHSYEGVLVKADILGHDVPTQMRILLDLTGVDPLGVPLDDPAVLSLFTSPDALGVDSDRIGHPTGTLGIPEFGTPLLKEILLETKPRAVGDLVRISGLSHGTGVWTGNAQDLVSSGRAALGQVIATREDIFNDLVSRRFDPPTAFRIMERVRKGKGLAEEDAGLMRRSRIPDWFIESCRKIEYLFPKAHAVAYVVGSLRIAWFKVHHPAAFYASYLTVNAADLDLAAALRGEAAAAAAIAEVRAKGREATAKEAARGEILEIAREAMARGVAFLPPHHERSHPTRFGIENGSLRPPFIAVAGLGAKAAEQIAAEREREAFRSVEEMAARCRLPRPVVEAMKRLGAFPGLPESDQASLF